MAEDSVATGLTHLVPTRVVEFANNISHFHEPQRSRWDQRSRAFILFILFISFRDFQ